MSIKDRIYEDDVDQLRELFVGKSVAKIDQDRVRLSDGTVLRLVGNEGCGGCESGNYALTELNECENAITDVAVDVHTVDDGIEPDRTYHLHVYAEDRRLNLASFHGTDGNGYYGTGFWIEIEDGDPL